MPNRTTDVQPTRHRCCVHTPYSPLPPRVHTSSQLSPQLSLHRPNHPSFHLRRRSQDPCNAQLKTKKHSISIVGRARQRVRSSHLIGSPSARHHSALAKVPALAPSHSRSRLATRQDIFSRTPSGDLNVMGHLSGFATYVRSLTGVIRRENVSMDGDGNSPGYFR